MSSDLQNSQVFVDLRHLIEQARRRAIAAVNTELTVLHWEIGHRIQSETLRGQRAAYGQEIFEQLAQQLTQEFGSGWGARHLRFCVKFVQAYPDREILNTLCSKLSWSHFKNLANLEDNTKRNFYTELCALERWSVRQLQERVQSMLFERTALSKSPETTIRSDLAAIRAQGEVSPAVLLKDPYVLDFLGLKDRFLERDMEDAVLREMEKFLLELGSGFSFVARQKRIQIDDQDFYLDLLFYNRKLKRLVAIELKIGDFQAQYKGQMELYLRWLAKYEQEADEQPPLGIILCSGKKREQIELLELDKSGIHVAQYLTELPKRELMQERFAQAVEDAKEKLSLTTSE